MKRGSWREKGSIRTDAPFLCCLRGELLLVVQVDELGEVLVTLLRRILVALEEAFGTLGELAAGPAV